MITKFRVKNYKALRDVEVDLTPMHVLIGPNDSGKSSILEAIGALCRSADVELNHALQGPWQGRQLVWQQNSSEAVSLEAGVMHSGTNFVYQLTLQFDPNSRQARLESEQFDQDGNTIQLRSSNDQCTKVYEFVKHGFRKPEFERAIAQLVSQALEGVQVCRWVPGLLALPNAQDAARRFRIDPSGFGLALCLDDILGADRERFAALEARFCAIFRGVESIQFRREPSYISQPESSRDVPKLESRDGKGLYFKKDGADEPLPASQMSDGALLVLAYLTVLYLPQPPRVLLIEEPENGIHPKRLADVLEILKQLVDGQQHTQVILTTHSPYVVDLFKPEDVTLCHKENDGSVSVHRLSNSKAVREQLDVFTLGEIWTAEGDDALADTASSKQEATP